MGKDLKDTYPELMTLDTGFYLAQSWVKAMTNVPEDESKVVQLEGRPSGLGLGAQITPRMKLTSSYDPVERKLRSKLIGEKKHANENIEESKPPSGNKNDSSDDDPDSRTSAFAKKRPMVRTANLQAKKKHR